MPPEFLYFDMGNVLLFFDHAQACRQIAALANLTENQVRQVIFESDLETRYESGALSSRQFYETFCEQTATRPDYDQFVQAAGDIFSINGSIVPVLAQLKGAGCRLGMLSNTCEMHWDYFANGRYALVPEIFEVVILSFRVKAMKPDAKIYTAAAEAAGVRPEQIFFTDDIAGHVAGARKVGFDAVQYTDTPALVQALHARGVRFNY